MYLLTIGLHILIKKEMLKIEGLQTWLGTIDEFYQDLGFSEFTSLIETIPGDLIPGKEQISKAKGTEQEKITDVIGEKTSKRQEFKHQIGQSGTYGDVEGMKKLEEQTLDPFYSQLSGIQGASGGLWGTTSKATENLLRSTR